MSVEPIKKRSNDPKDWSVLDTLRSLINEIESGEQAYDKCFICLVLTDENGDTCDTYRMAQMNNREAVMTLEIIKSDLTTSINSDSDLFN